MGDCFTGTGFILEVMGVLELIKEDYEYNQCNRSSWIRYFKMRKCYVNFVSWVGKVSSCLSFTSQDMGLG